MNVCILLVAQTLISMRKIIKTMNTTNSSFPCIVNKKTAGAATFLYGIILFVVLVSSTNVYSQKIKVTSFELLPFDQTANSPATEKIDQNNERCAIIKVETMYKDFYFDVGILGVWHVDESHIGEIWVYVPNRVNHITIRHPKFGVLRNYQIPCEIEEARTYLMKLEVEGAQNANKNVNIADSVISFKLGFSSFNMVYVKGGTFNMGCTKNDKSECYEEELPVHQVELSDFYIGQVEVTQNLWMNVMGEGLIEHYNKIEESEQKYIMGQGGNVPMYYVSWDECQEFIKKLNELTGRTFSLPTEAQWEYAARGGQKSINYIYSGSNVLDDVGWNDHNSDYENHHVATLKPNELGIYDMSGNVWEWCEDNSYLYTEAYVKNPVYRKTNEIWHIIRGGCWNNIDEGCTVTCRMQQKRSRHAEDTGFRLVMLPE